MKPRVLLAAVLTAVLALTLSACQTKVGAAAVVDGHRIAESDLQDYVQPGAKPFDNQGSTIVPRTFVLQDLISERVLKRALDKNGGDPTQAELTRARAQVFSQTSESDLRKLLTNSGFDSSFAPVYERVQSYIAVLQERIPDQTKAVAAVTNSGVKVQVSARYGVWNASRLTLNNGPGTPGFIATDPSSAAATPAG